MNSLDQILGHEAAGQTDTPTDPFPITWSKAYREELRRVADRQLPGHSAADAELARVILLCTDGHFSAAGAQLVFLLRRDRNSCLDDAETFISYIYAAFVAQRFDLVGALLRARHGYGRHFEVGLQRGVGRNIIRWDILPSGKHRFVFDAGIFESDNTRTEVLLFQWAFPLFAAWSKMDGQQSGSLFINQGDMGQVPGLAYCDNRPEYFLVPDYIFVPNRGYEYARRVLLDRSPAWGDRSAIAFWRGGTTGNPTTPNEWRSLERVRLCELAQRHIDSGRLDIGISSIVQFDDPQIVREIESSGLMRPPVPWEDWGRYKYLIDIDGNSSPWSNLFQKLLTGSPVLKVESPRGLRQWYYGELAPWVNYVPIAPDMSDLMSKIQWLDNNDAKARAIGEAGLALANRLTYEREMARAMKVISAAFHYFNGRPEGAEPFGQRPYDWTASNAPMN